MTEEIVIDSEKKAHHVLPGVAAACLAVLVLGFDLNMPLGVAGGVPYAAMVMIGLWLPRREHVIYLALIGTMLTLVGYYYSPQGGDRLGGIHQPGAGDIRDLGDCNPYL